MSTSNQSQLYKKMEKELNKEGDDEIVVFVKEKDEIVVIVKEEKEEEAEQPQLGNEPEESEKTDTESGNEFETEPEYESTRYRDDEDSDDEEDFSDEHIALVHWRINFRCRNRMMSDHIIVDVTSPTQSLPADPFSQFERGIDGATLAGNFQFRHKLKETTYKNKYILRLDGYVKKFSERKDSVLIQSATEATVYMGISNNSVDRSNMAMEELRHMLSMKLRVCRSLFVSNRSQQMGEMDLTKYVNTITADTLNVSMDSCANTIQVVNLHTPQLHKFTLDCCDEFSEVMNMDQVRNCPNLKLIGPSATTDEQLLALKATNFDFTSEKITGKGLNAFLQARLAEDIPDTFYSHIECRRGWDTEEVFKGLECTEYENREAFIRVNETFPVNVYQAALISIPTNKPVERLAIILTNCFFECFKEAHMPQRLSHNLSEFC